MPFGKCEMPHHSAVACTRRANYRCASTLVELDQASDFD